MFKYSHIFGGEDFDICIWRKHSFSHVGNILRCYLHAANLQGRDGKSQKQKAKKKKVMEARVDSGRI